MREENREKERIKKRRRKNNLRECKGKIGLRI
jgi:hypothetical protein